MFFLFVLQDFRFQQLCRIRIFDPPDSPFQGVTQLIACSSKYGLTFLGTTNGDFFMNKLYVSLAFFSIKYGTGVVLANILCKVLNPLSLLSIAY